MDKVIILGGGIAGLSLASFLKSYSIVLERDQSVGGLSKSYLLDGVPYDLGPHIIFSKNKFVLDLHNSMIPVNQIRRSNKILYKNRYIKYPFENDLGSLPEDDRDFCLKEFLKNPYEVYDPKNMLQFFLSKFGEGITQLYLRPYNEKIWKFDPSYMDLQMVQRIPKPPAEDVIASASGIATEGYTHQLNFSYPQEGGFQTLVNEYERLAMQGGEVRTGIQISKIEKVGGRWVVKTNFGDVDGDRIVSCIPIHELFKILAAPDEVVEALSKLQFNSIHVVTLHVKQDSLGDNFAVYIPDRDVIFHRISKVDFLGKAYSREGDASTLITEVTFRPGSYLSTQSVQTVERRVINDLCRLGVVKISDVVSVETRTEEYAYVVYDLHHRQNVDLILGFLHSVGIRCVGRFAEFEYLNTDGVVERTLELAKTMNGEADV